MHLTSPHSCCCSTQGALEISAPTPTPSAPSTPVRISTEKQTLKATRDLTRACVCKAVERSAALHGCLLIKPKQHGMSYIGLAIDFSRKSSRRPHLAGSRVAVGSADPRGATARGPGARRGQLAVARTSTTHPHAHPVGGTIYFIICKLYVHLHTQTRTQRPHAKC